MQNKHVMNSTEYYLLILHPGNGQGTYSNCADSKRSIKVNNSKHTYEYDL